MALVHRVEPWAWFCGGDLAPSAGAGSPWLAHGAAAAPTTCLRQAIVSFTQMLLLVAFFLCVACFPSILPGALSRSELRKAFEVGSILYNVTAVLSGLVALAFLTAATWVLVAGDHLFPHTWLSLLLQGVAWLTIACSLRVRLRNPTKQVAYVWWILTFLLATLAMFLASLDLLTGATALSVELFLVISSWPVSCLLLTCAINGERWIMVEVPDALESPLLTDAMAS